MSLCSFLYNFTCLSICPCLSTCLCNCVSNSHCLSKCHCFLKCPFLSNCCSLSNCPYLSTYIHPYTCTYQSQLFFLNTYVSPLCLTIVIRPYISLDNLLCTFIHLPLSVPVLLSVCDWHCLSICPRRSVYANRNSNTILLLVHPT